MLRAVNHNGKIYFQDIDLMEIGSKMRLPIQKSKFNITTKHFLEKQRQITDEELNKKISELKYPVKKEQKKKSYNRSNIRIKLFFKDFPQDKKLLIHPELQ